MGCTQSRESMLEGEERVLVELEEQLNFGSNSCLLADLSFRKYSHNREINENQWEDIAYILCLTPFNTKKSRKAEEFFKSYKNKSCYHFQSLLLAAILLSDGYPRQKAKLIFELYDHDNDGILDKREFTNIITDLIDLSLRKIPILLYEKNSDVLRYIQELKEYEENIKSLFLEKFQNACKEYNFVNCFIGWNVFSPSDLRKHIAYIRNTDSELENLQNIIEDSNLA